MGPKLSARILEEGIWNMGGKKDRMSYTHILFRVSPHKIMQEDLKVKIKPQYVDYIAQLKHIKDLSVGDVLNQQCPDMKMDMQFDLQLDHLRNHPVSVLSGGELQRLAIAICLSQKAHMYFLDEPSSFLDIRQRITMANIVRKVAKSSSESQSPYVIVVEHDLSLLDYMSETICCLYGKPGVYGVVTKPFGVREGINHYLAGYLPTENLRFRKEGLVFKAKMSLDSKETEELTSSDSSILHSYSYPSVIKELGENKSRFKLTIEKGSFHTSEILVFLGENGMGKTTLLRHLFETLKMNMSYKPQQITPSWKGTVQTLFDAKIASVFYQELFQKEVVLPLDISRLLDRKVQELSGGELQRVALVLALGKPADVYLLDEPSAYLDCEQRIVTAQILKRFILQTKKVAIVVEHDFIMLNYLGDKVIVFEGRPGIEATARAPTPLSSGVSSFLKHLNITIRRDPTNLRPRINKLGSVKDQTQKKAGVYFDVTVDAEPNHDKE